MNDQDAIEATAKIAFKALDKAKAWYLEILEQRYGTAKRSPVALTTIIFPQV